MRPDLCFPARISIIVVLPAPERMHWIGKANESRQRTTRTHHGHDLTRSYTTTNAVENDFLIAEIATAASIAQRTAEPPTPVLRYEIAQVRPLDADSSTPAGALGACFARTPLLPEAVRQHEEGEEDETSHDRKPSDHPSAERLVLTGRPSRTCPVVRDVVDDVLSHAFAIDTSRQREAT